MKTVRYKGVEIHVGCEGTVVKGVCVRCGARKPSWVERHFGKEPLAQHKPRLDERTYKKRIRDMEDI